jgi:Calcineurin-like phosphoesterase
MAAQGKTVKTRILVMSDSADFSLNDDHAESRRAFSRNDLPKADLLLFCGNLTNTGSIEAYRLALNMLAQFDVSQKFVIGGQCDVNLDPVWWGELWETYGFERNEAQRARDCMTGAMAQGARVKYLEEGTRTVSLSNGAKFTLYASPYQAVDRDWAFSFQRNQDPFNSPAQVPLGTTSIGDNHIPDFPNVDIVMTHTPPQGMLDQIKGRSRGCPSLLRALERARPRLHCFGQSHEGHGARIASWMPRSSNSTDSAGYLQNPVFEKVISLPVIYPEPVRCRVEAGRQTLMVNGSIMNGEGKLRNQPWFIEIDLPTKESWDARNRTSKDSWRVKNRTGRDSLEARHRSSRESLEAGNRRTQKGRGLCCTSSDTIP